MIIDSHMDCTFRTSVTEPEKYSGIPYHNPAYIKLAVKSAVQIDLAITQGTYCWTLGPSYETPAEVSYIRSLGGYAVGMSTVPEIQAATKLGMKVLGISTITNYAAGIIDKPLSHDDVIKVSVQVKDDFTNLLTEIIKGMVL
jgi:purine-nucleoside phosphorylase